MIYVVFQFGFLLILAYRALLFPVNAFSLFLVLCGLGTGLVAIFSMGRPFNIRPRPHEGRDQIVRHGIYAHIRHPMYLAVLLFAAGLLVQNTDILNISFYGGLIITLLLKLNYEEKALQSRFPKYKEYKKKTYKLIPFVY